MTQTGDWARNLGKISTPVFGVCIESLPSNTTCVLKELTNLVMQFIDELADELLSNLDCSIFGTAVREDLNQTHSDR